MSSENASLGRVNCMLFASSPLPWWKDKGNYLLACGFHDGVVRLTSVPPTVPICDANLRKFTSTHDIEMPDGDQAQALRFF